MNRSCAESRGRDAARGADSAATAAAAPVSVLRLINASLPASPARPAPGSSLGVFHQDIKHLYYAILNLRESWKREFVDTQFRAAQTNSLNSGVMMPAVSGSGPRFQQVLLRRLR